MRKIGLLALSLTFLLSNGTAFVNAERNKAPKEEKIERYIVGYTKEKKMKKLDKNKFEKYGKVLKQYDAINAVLIESTDAKIKNLKSNDKKISVEKDKIAYTDGQEVSWGHNRSEGINSEVMWNKGLNGKGVTVAVIDTGVKANHEDFDSTKIETLDVSERSEGTPENLRFIPVSGQDAYGDGHGTHVAGIIAAQNNNIGVRGIADGVNIVSYRVDSVATDDKPSSMTWTVVLEALNHIYNRNMDANDANDIDIINMSLSTSIDTTPENEPIFTEEIVNKLHNKGVTMVASSGNVQEPDENGDGEVLQGTYRIPASFDHVISVGNLKRELIDSGVIIAENSVANDRVDFAAPGTQIHSTWTENVCNDDVLLLCTPYKTVSGTSQASPLVAGLLALYKESNPNLTPNELEQILKKNAVTIERDKTNEYGNGAVKANFEEFKQMVKQTIILKADDVDKKFYTAHPGIGLDETTVLTRKVTTDTRAIATEAYEWNEAKQRFNWYKLNVPSLEIFGRWYQLDDATEKIDYFDHGRYNAWWADPGVENARSMYDEVLSTYMTLPGNNAALLSEYSVPENISHLYILGENNDPKQVEGLKMEFQDSSGTVIGMHSVTAYEANQRYFKLPKRMENVKKIKYTTKTEAKISEFAIHNDIGPDRVSQLNVTGDNGNKVYLAWEKSEEATKYYIEYKSTKDTSFPGFPTKIETTNTSLEIAVEPDTTYEFTVKPVNENGQGDGSYVKHKTLAVPSPLSNLKTGEITSSTVDLSWSPSERAEKYRVTYTTRKTGMMMPPIITVGEITGTSIKVTGLQPNVEYQFTVQPKNSLGSGTNQSLWTRTLEGTPTALTGLMVTGATTSSASLSWNASTYATKYKIEYRLAGTTDEFNLFSEVTSLNVNVTGLTGGKTYEFRVTPMNNTASGLSQSVNKKLPSPIILF